MKGMKITEFKTDELIPYINNPRNNDEAVDYVAASIKEFGFRQPIIIDKDKVIVAGHTRLKAAKKLGLETVPCIMADDLSEQQIKAFRLADNKVSEFASWDMDKLMIELEALDDIDMSEYGFDELEKEAEAFLEEVEEDELPEEIEARSKIGQIWQLGEHRLMCGDSTKPDDVDKLMGNETADMVFTDPPYGVSYKGTNNPNGREWEIIKGDELRGDELFLFLLEAFKNIKRKLRRGGSFYIWYANSNSIQFETALKGAELKKKQIIIWSKGMVLGHSDYHWTYEPCLYGCHPDMNCEWFGDRAQKTLWDLSKKELKDLKKDEMLTILERLHNDKDVWEIKRDPVNEYIHPTQKPVALSAKALHNSSKKGDIILDLFGGSGSTLMGCEQLNRKARMMEFDPKYCDLIIQRWENYTGQKAQLIEG